MVVGGLIPICSGFETVLLRFRGFTGSYSQRRPRSRQRSHCGRSSLHFFFFSLLMKNEHEHKMKLEGNEPGLQWACAYQCTQPGEGQWSAIWKNTLHMYTRNIGKEGSQQLTCSRATLGDFGGDWTMVKQHRRRGAVKHEQVKLVSNDNTKISWMGGGGDG